MIPDDVPGVVPAPIYTAVPCEDSTCPLADELASKYPQLDAIGVELNILRWLVDNGMRFSDLRELQTAANMAGLEMEFLELREAAARWEWFVRHASLGFDGAPSWNAVVRLPVFDSDDQTITALVDRARNVAGDA